MPRGRRPNDSPSLIGLTPRICASFILISFSLLGVGLKLVLILKAINAVLKNLKVFHKYQNPKPSFHKKALSSLVLNLA